MDEKVSNENFCSHCCLKFDSEVWYDLHLQLVHGNENKTEPLENKVECMSKEKVFPIDLSTKSTITHKVEKCFKCNICISSFTSKQNLKKHISIHKGENPFKCNICNEQFATERRLSIHTFSFHNDGENEKSYTCNYCDSKFPQNRNLKRHINIVHKGIKQYKCNICENSFSVKQHLIVHLSSIHDIKNPFKCKNCEVTFDSSFNLRRHFALAHEYEKRFKCNICNNACYAQKRSLKNHIKTFHNS